MERRISLVTATAALIPLLPAQVIVVAAGGGGQFTDLPAAIAAAPDGATLHVKPGSYSEFTVASKSLTILAETAGSVTVAVSTACTITGLSASQHVHVSGLRFTASWWETTLSVTGCAGSVGLDGITMPPSGLVPKVVIDQCSDVHLLGWNVPAVTTGISEQFIGNRFTVSGSNVEIAASSLAGGAPTLLVKPASVLMLTDTTVAGGRGKDAIPNGPGGSGYDAIQIQGPATAHLSGACAVRGGPGGSQTLTWPIACNGGNGLVLSNALVRAFGAVLAGGYPGGGPGSQPGQPCILVASSLEQLPSSGASAFLTGTMGPGQRVTLSLRAAPGTAADLLLGSRSAFARPYPIALGALCVQPVLVIDALAVPASGLLEIPVQLPKSWPRDSVVLAQFLTLDPKLGEVQASSSFAAITR